MSALNDAARAAMTKCLAVQPGDYVLIVTDEVCQEVGRAFREVASELEAETLYLQIAARHENGEEPPIGVAEIMREMDVVLVPTAKSITHTEARRRACKAGARIATMPGVTPEMLARCMAVDVEALAQRVRDLARAMHGRSEVHVTSTIGTDLRFSMEGARIFQDTGMIRQPGDFGNIPAGKLSLATVEGSARGELVVDAAAFGRKLASEPLRLRIEGGRVTAIEGSEVAKTFSELIQAHGEGVRNLAEFGLGVHDKAVLTGNSLEDEKVLGTVHFAFGNNRSLGGSVDVPIYEIGVLTNAKVTLDGRTILEAGALKP
jgi:leucyl aminopeptidase (aminopeptidase T)